MDTDSLQQLIEQSTAQTGKDIANMPVVENTNRQQLFGQDPTLASLQSNEVSKIQELYEHDKSLAQKYAPTPQNPQGGKQNPFDPSLIMNPYGDEQFKAQQDQATQKQLGDIQNASQSRRDILGNVLDKVMKAYQSHIDSEKYMSDTYQKELQGKLSQKDTNIKNLLSVLDVTGGNLPDDVAKQIGLPSGTRIPSQTEREIAKLQATNKFNQSNSQSDVVNFFENAKNGKGYVSPQTYLQAKNAFIQAGGDAKKFDENFRQYRAPTSSQYAVDPNSLTSNERKSMDQQKAELTSLQNLTSTSQQVANKLQSVPYFERMLPGIEHMNPDMASAYSQLYQSLGDLRKNAVGGRITQAEIGWLLGNVFPSKNDFNSAMNAKVQVLNDELQKKQSNPDYIIGSGSSQGATVTRKAVVEKLKNNGYDDNQIHAYLKAKGVDK